MNLPKRKESDILSSCLKLLKGRGIFALRMNVGAMKQNGRYVRFGLKGCADILAFERRILGLPLDHAGTDRFEILWVECKRLTGKQSPAQKEFQTLVEAEGHRYVVVHSAEELSTVLG